jgi:hypothetical protein
MQQKLPHADLLMELALKVYFRFTKPADSATRTDPRASTRGKSTIPSITIKASELANTRMQIIVFTPWIINYA